APFELVESLLKFDCAAVCEIGTPCRKARRLEIRDRADRITLCRVRDLWQVPPWGFFLALLVFCVFPGRCMPEPILYEQREPCAFDHANPVEVIVAAILLGCLGVQC